MPASLLPRLLLGTLLMAAAPVLHSADQSDSNQNLWLNYVGDHPFGNSPWGIHLESQFRRADYGEHWQQLLLRTGINYAVSPTLSVTAGYAYVDTYPYGDIPVAHEFPEHRLWQQVMFSHKAAGLEWTHRLRLEQRRIGEMLQQNGEWDVANWRYENRFRYMLRTTIPLSSDKKWYLALWDELFLNFGSNVSLNYFDQNRIFVGLGRKLSDTTRLEVGFMEQTVQRRGGNVWENNHTISVWLMSKWPFKF